jgi:A/G-specific adenine glycosylase
LGLQKRKSKLLLRAANYIVEKCNGEFPKTYEELVKIPGIGQYLANAILCFAFNQPTIPVDVNVKRVIEKFFKINIKNVRKIDKNISDILKEIGTAWGNFKEAAWCLIDFGSQLASTKKNSAQIKKEILNR